MLRYDQYTKKIAPLYVAAVCDAKTSLLLTEWCSQNDFDTSVDYKGNLQEQFKFHSTIMYSINEQYFEPKILSCNIREYAVEYKVLGKNSDVPVLGTTESSLVTYRNKYVNEGWIPSFTIFKPHVSLSYVKRTDYLEKKVQLPSFPIIFDRIEIESVNE